MNRLKIALFFVACITLLSSSKAQDPKAKSILEKLSTKTKAYQSIQAEFDYKMINLEEEINETQSGKLLSQGNSYKFEIEGQIIVSNGTTIWTIIEDAEEVQVSDVPDPEDNEDVIDPRSILTLWEKGFKFKYEKEAKINDQVVDVIKLFPEKPDEKSFHTILLSIDKDESIVRQIEIKGKDGTDFIYLVKSFTPNQKVKESEFNFSPKQHPDYEVIDLR